MPRCHCSAYGRLVLVAVARHARIGGDELRRRRRLDRDDRREGIGDRPHPREVERIGFVIDVLRDHERHVEVIEVSGRVGTRKIGDAEAGAQDRRGIRRQLVGDPQTRRQVAVLRLLVRAPAGAVFAGVDDDEVLIVEVGDPVVLLRRRAEDLVAQAGVDGQPVVDLEVVLHERPPVPPP